MLRTDAGIWYSPSDLLNWMTCPHRSALDARKLTDPDLSAWLKTRPSPLALVDPDDENGTEFDEPAQLRGDMHERAMLAGMKASGRQIVEIDRPAFTSIGIQAAHSQTVAAMRAGAEVIFQATLLAAPWYGFADFLVRRDDVHSGLGEYAYEIRDTKLARTASAKALLQMALYGQVVSAIQGTPPPALVVWLGSGEEFYWKYTDAEPYLRQAQARFLAAQIEQEPTNAEPIAACGTCRWHSLCDEEWGPHDLIRIHRLSSNQRALLRDHAIDSTKALATAADVDRPPGMASATFERLRSQAAVQTGTRPYALVIPQAASSGLASIPAPDPDDIYFDLEGDPFAGMPTLDYLWAFCDAEGFYASRWAHDPAAERAAFAWFMQMMEAKDVAGGNWHVYHYNSYETASMRRIARDWPEEKASLQWQERVETLIAHRFVDLYRSVEVGLRTKAGTTSLKEIEKLAGYDRTEDAAGVSKADQSIEEYERYVFSQDEDVRAQILANIEHYNLHDVRATLATHLWLHALAQQIGPDDLIEPDEPYVQSDKLLEKLEKIAALRDRLLDTATKHDFLPSGLPAEGARNLAAMLEWHRKEEVVKYVDFLRLKTWALEEADPNDSDDFADALAVELNGPRQESATSIRPGTEHESCILDVEVLQATPPVKPKRVTTFSMSCRPGAWKIKEGDSITESLPIEDERKPVTTKVLAFDAQAGTLTFATTTVRDAYGPFVKAPINAGDAAWDALMRLGEAALATTPGPEFATGIGILSCAAPLLPEQMQPVAGESAQLRARKLVKNMGAGVLPIQGPPGTGKTWLGAHIVVDMIRELADQQRTPVIAVTANAHRVIDNMLIAIADRAASEGVMLSIAHTGPDDKIESDARILHTGANGDLAGWIATQQTGGAPLVIGATKGAWALPTLTLAADLLIVDEAGQVTLADALAVAQCAPVVVALGDPQQLAAPVQAAHDEAVNKSLLEYLSQGADVLPDHVGVFLDETWRLHPAVCQVVSHLAYDGELRAAGDALNRDIAGKSFTVAGTLITCEPGVQWVPIDGDDDAEVAAVLAAIVGLAKRATVTQADGQDVALGVDEILVVAPHNAHVNKIKASVPAGIRVGTVDLFQGQEAHVVIFSMGRVATGARDVGFLYEINRLNVALSRARLKAIVISSRDAVFPPVGTPEDLLLASRFIEAVAD